MRQSFSSLSVLYCDAVVLTSSQETKLNPQSIAQISVFI